MSRAQVARRGRALGQALRRRLARAALAGLAVGLSVAPHFGCGREFFRHWADQDVSEAVFEKSRDPRWRIDRFTIEPPALSRFAQPYDIDRQPAPPDDQATEALSPTPQLPYHRTLVPAEGTGYLDMLNKGRRYQGPPPVVNVPVPDASLEHPVVPTPGPGTPSPFRSPLIPDETGILPANPPRNSGTTPGGTTPNTDTTPNPSPNGTTPPGDSPPQASRRTRDHGVLQTAFQAPGSTTPTAVPGPSPLPTGPGGTQVPAGRGTQAPKPPQERLQEPAISEDPEGPNAVNANTNPLPLPGRNLAQTRADRAGVSTFLERLTPLLNFNEAQAAGYSVEARPFVIGPAEALQLALINSRAYQFNLENVYTAALPVTLTRFGFQTQFFAGASPQTGVATGTAGAGLGGGLIPNNPSNNFIYQTKEYPGGQVSRLNYGTAAGFGKALAFGGRLAAGFANQTTFNFLSSKPSQPTVQSFLPLTFIQPFLRGAGRAVILEGLTQNERTLLYNVRLFARFRQQVVPVFLAQNQNFTEVTQGTAADPTPGYLGVLLILQSVENDRRNVLAYEKVLELYEEYVKGGASSGISQIQVDQVAQQLQSSRGRLLGDEANFKTQLDSYKMSLGLPPDVPLLLDRAPTAAFRTVYNDLDRWARRENHDPEELNGILNGLPKLEPIVVDGRELFKYDGRRLIQAYANPERQQEFLLAVERVALENRLDLMNNRAQLYDAWRQLAVSANALQGVFNVTINNQIATPTSTTNPFAFIDQAKQFNLSFQSELPLVRVAERNNYRTAVINYQRQQRLLQSIEDDIKLSVRQETYNLINNAENYEIARLNLLITVRQRDQTLQAIIAPPDASAAAGGGNNAQQSTQTLNLINSINNVLTQQQTILSNWVQFQTQRLALFRDLGLLPYDEWEAFYEFFPASSGPGNAASTGSSNATPAGSAGIAPAPGRP